MKENHPRRRPGGRTARVEASVLDATLTELGAGGYGGLSVDAIAARAGVHKTTLYRRWSGIDGLVAAALRRSADDDWEPARSGDLHTDLVGLGQSVVDGFGTAGDRSVATAAVAASFVSNTVASALRDFYARRLERSAVVVADAVARGELSPDVDAVEVVRLAVAPLYLRLFVTREPITSDDVRRAAAVATAAAGSAALTRHR